MNRKPLETLLYSTGGIAALVLVLIAFNFLVSALSVRADLTEGNVYTLSDGTRSVLAKLEAPVKLRLYYSQGSEAVPVALKTFAKRVEDLLNEYQAAHIPGARHVAMSQFDPESKELAKAKELPVAVYDRQGTVSAQAAERLAKAGFTRVYWLEGGIAAWQGADLPTAKGKA